MPKWMKSAAPEDPVSHVARRCLKARLKQVLRYLPLAAQQAENDIEHVHQLRVWTRRARAAAKLFSLLLPERRGAWIGKRLKQIRATAGDARDLDVLLERLADAPPPGEDVARLLADLRERRCAAQPAIVALFEKLSTGDKLRRRVKGLIRRVRWRSEGDEARYGPWADDQLRDVLTTFFEAASADHSDLDALHQFRIAGKKLRYTMELLAGAYPRSFRKQLYGEIVTLQERLGVINDHRVAQARYLSWAEECNNAPDCSLLERLAGAEEIALNERRAEFASWWHEEQADELRRRFEEYLARRS